jgi:hypothetical protein
VRKVERKHEEPIEKYSRSDMNDKVYQMIAKNIELPKIVAEGEGKVGEHPDRSLIGVLDKLLHPIPCENLDLDIGILEDIGSVIEKKGDRESIRISHQCHAAY